MRLALLARWTPVAAAGCLLIFFGTTRAQASTVDNEPLDWTRLEYQASKLGFRIEASVELSSASGSQLRQALIEPGEGLAVTPEGGSALLLEIDSTGLGRESLVDFWFRTDLAALQRRQIETGGKTKRNRFKINRFASNGVFNLTRRPAVDQVNLPHEEWSDRSEGFKVFPGPALGHGPVSEPSVLFYAISASDLATAGDRVAIPVLSKGRVALVTLTVRGSEAIKVDYEEVSREGVRRLRGRNEVLAITLESRPLEPGSRDVDLRFLGLGGEIVLFVDPVHRVPVQVSGSIKYAGRAHLRLRRLDLR